jgi:DNA-damage-inducible protein J
MVHVRVKEDVKAKAERALEAMGMSISDAVRILLVRVAADNAFPFSLKVPNTRTRKAMRPLDQGKGKRQKNAKGRFADMGFEVLTILRSSQFARNVKLAQR